MQEQGVADRRGVTSRLVHLVLVLALVAPAAGLGLWGSPSQNRKSCCPPACADAPPHIRACCPTDGAAPAAGPTTPSVLRAPATVRSAAVPHSGIVESSPAASPAPIGAISMRLLTGVLLI